MSLKTKSPTSSSRPATSLAAAFLFSGIAAQAGILSDLSNPGFEDLMDPYTDTNWRIHSDDTYKWVKRETETSTSPYAHAGSSCVLEIQMANSASIGSASEAYETIACDAGQDVDFSGWVVSPSQFPLRLGYYATLRIAFNGTGGESLGTYESVHFLYDNNNNWTSLDVKGTAPVGTASVTVYAMMVRQTSDDTSGSTIWFDDMALTMSPASPIPEPATVVWLAGLGVLVAAARLHRGGRPAPL